jgi:hypothetical protein
LETKQENPQALVDFIPKVLSPADVSPGMEPFDEGRREFFWGRTRQVDDLLSILQSSRFLGITGPEGSGKTSLVRAGLMPMLRKGFKGLAGSQWQFCRLRPGISPIDNLAAALSDVDTGSPVSKGSLEWQGEIVKLMRKDHTGLLNAWNAGKMDVSRNLLVVIDNFEDIFTVARKSNPGLAWEQEVNLLFSNMARVLSAPNVPVYFCILMESSYLPSLYNFRVLSPFLSGGLYTLPNFRQDDFAQLARSPLLKLRRELTPEAVSMLQSQFNNDLRNLPALQFKLKALGGLQADAKGMIGPAELLSTPSLDRIVPESLDAFYEGLGEGERNTMKELFSHISQPGEGASRKRPQTVRDIVEKRELDRRDLIKLLTRFKQEMPGVLDVVEPFQRNVTHFMEWNLSDHAIVNLNNAYPLRDWARLEGWIEEERRAEAMYLRLSNAALMFEQEQTGYLRPPELDNFLNWWEDYKPHKGWTEQFNSLYDVTHEYLRKSRDTHVEELERREAARVEELRKARKRMLIGIVVGAISLIAAVVALFFYRYAQEQSRIAINEKKIADAATDTAKVALTRAQQAEKNAKLNAEIAERDRALAVEQQNKALAAKLEADRQKTIAQAEEKRADESAAAAKKTAEKNRVLADTATAMAQRELVASRKATYRALYEKAGKEIVNLLNEARTSEFETRESKVEFIREVSDLYQAYDSSSRFVNNGVVMPNDNLFQLLSMANAMVRVDMKGNATAMREIVNLRGKGLRDVDIHAGSRVAAVGDQKQLILYDLPGGKQQSLTVGDNNSRIRSVSFIDRERVAILNVTGTVYQYNLTKNAVEMRSDFGKTPGQLGGLVATSGRIFAVRDGKLTVQRVSDPKFTESDIRNVDRIFRLSGTNLMVSASDGLHILNAATLQHAKVGGSGILSRVTAVAEGPGRIFLGNEGGSIMSYNANAGQTNLVPSWPSPIQAHKTRVTSLHHEPGQAQLFTAGMDMTSKIYQLDLPSMKDVVGSVVTLNGFRKWIWDFEMVPTPQGAELFSVDEEGALRRWVTKPSEIHRQLQEWLKKETRK